MYIYAYCKHLAFLFLLLGFIFTNIPAHSQTCNNIPDPCRSDIFSNLSSYPSLTDLYPSEQIPYVPIKDVKLVFHIFQRESPLSPSSFEDIPLHVNYLSDWVNHPSLGANAVLSNLCNSNPDLTDSRIRFNLTKDDIFFYEDSDAWDNGHFWCPNSFGPRFNYDRQCQIYDEYVDGPTGSQNLTPTQQDAIHILFMENSERWDGLNLALTGAFAHALGSADHRNYVVMTGMLENFNSNNQALTDVAGKRLIHEISLLMGENHDFSPSNNLLGHDAGRCSFELEHLQTFHYFLEGGSFQGKTLTIEDADLTDYCSLSGSDIVVSSGSDVEWTQDMKVNSNIIVESGAKLTISNCTIGLPADAIVQVKEGGELILDGALLTSNCGGYWEHIEVNGNPSLSQTPSNQGRLEMISSTIEFAKTV